jgi:hypothetical protein
MEEFYSQVRWIDEQGQVDNEWIFQPPSGVCGIRQQYWYINGIIREKGVKGGDVELLNKDPNMHVRVEYYEHTYPYISMLRVLFNLDEEGKICGQTGVRRILSVDFPKRGRRFLEIDVPNQVRVEMIGGRWVINSLNGPAILGETQNDWLVNGIPCRPSRVPLDTMSFGDILSFYWHVHSFLFEYIGAYKLFHNTLHSEHANNLTQLDCKGEESLWKYTGQVANLNIRFFMATCGTGKEIALYVPRSVTTVEEAQAWVQGSSKWLKPEVRT